MSLFDSASLVVTPNGQKAGKLYSIKPTDGSGDLSVTRATSATRVNSAGLVEIPRTNLLTYSEQFDNAAWTKTNVTVTSNSTISPDGNTTADTLTKSTAGVDGTVVRVVSATATGYVGSIFVKKDTDVSRFPELFLRSSDSTGQNEIYVQLNTSTGATAIRLQTGTASVSTPVLIDGYWRISYYVLANSNTCRFGIRPAAGTTLGVFNANATGSIIAWGAQLEEGNVVTEYIPTIASIRTKFAGITQDGGSASNIPRLDYTNGTCPSILVEPQRTNLLSYSEQFDNAYWSKTNMAIVANDTTAPDGTTTADKATASFYPSTSITKSNLLTATNHTLSVYVKAGSVSTFRLDLVTAGFALGSNCIFNLSTLATTITNYGVTTGTTAKITSVGNGWYRCSLTVLTTAVIYFAQLYPAANGSVYLWGAQLEAGSYATSYIPTVASSVTRNADVISKTGISSLIGQTEGTLFLDLQYSNISGLDMFLSIRPNSSNKIEIFRDGGVIYAEVAATNSVSISSSKPIGSYKIAFAYKSGSTALYINGTLISQSTTTFNFTNTLSDLYLNSRAGTSFIESANFKTAAIFKTRLTNDELAQLTTL